MILCCRSWWPLYRYVLARLILCVSHLLSLPPAEFLYDVARIDNRTLSASGGPQQPAATAVEPASNACSAPATAGSQTDAESCQIALKGAFEMLNILALREDFEDPDGVKRRQMYEFVTTLLSRLKLLDPACNSPRWLFHVDLRAVVVWTTFAFELHRKHMLSGEAPSVTDSSLVPQGEHQQQRGPHSANDVLLIGRVCFQHRLGFDLTILNCAELVTSSWNKATCFLKVCSEQDSAKKKSEGSSIAEPASVTLQHDALCCCDVYLDQNEIRGINGLALRCLNLSWALCPSVCFQIATLCCTEREFFGNKVAVTGISSNCRVLPGGCWPHPLRRALLFRRLCIPLPPLCDVERSGLAEPILPYVCLSKV